MQSTLGDFVKMLYEGECGVVVMLCGCEEGGVEMCAQYWPTTTDTTTKHEELLVTTVKVTEGDGITQRLIAITDAKVCVNFQNHYCHCGSMSVVGSPSSSSSSSSLSSSLLDLE